MARALAYSVGFPVAGPLPAGPPRVPQPPAIASEFMILSRLRRFLVPAAALGALAGCAVVPPSYPTVQALPAAGKTLDAFRHDDDGCRTYAAQRVNPLVANGSAARAAAAAPVLGTAGGAAAGALIGAGAGNAGKGAAIGAGAGLLLGASAGLRRQGATQAALQRQYDHAYAQCMVASGDSIVAPVRPAPVVYAPPPVVYARPVYYYAY